MKKWILKAIVQKTISFLPFKNNINYFFQKYVTKGVLLTDSHFELKITHASDHLRFYKKHSSVQRENWNTLVCMELGSGWYPVVPISLFLNGMGKVISIDINSWMNKASILKTIEHFISWRADGRLYKFIDSIDADRWAILLEVYNDAEKYSFTQICEQLNLELMIKDARATELPDQSMDFICSNNTYEHIPGEILFGIIKEFNRICKKKGIMSHFIDLSDHFAHFDSSINIYNFLKYSEAAWQRIDNSIQPQNRLRWKEYLKMYEDLAVPITEEEIRKGSPSLVGEVEIHEMYSDFSPEELAISHGYIISVA